MIRVLLFCLLNVVMVNVSATEFKGIGILGADFGGDTLVDVEYSDGSKAKVDAGEGLSLGGGLSWNLKENVSLITSAAWKFTTTKQASNGDITWTRIPLEVIGLYQIDKIKVGAGLSYQVGNKLKGSGIASDLDVKFDNALGYVANIEYAFTPKFAVNARYMVISYTPEDGSASVNGNNFGMGLVMYFDQK